MQVNTGIVTWACGCQMQYSAHSTNLTLVLRLVKWCPKHRMITVLVGKEKVNPDDQLDRQQMASLEPPQPFEQDPMNPCGATDPRF